MSISKKIETIVDKAAKESEKLILDGVRKTMSQRNDLDGFIFAMGQYFFYTENADYIGGKEAFTSKAKGLRDILTACGIHLDSFGTITWRVDRDERQETGFLERTGW